MRLPVSGFCLIVLAAFGFALADSSSRNVASGASSVPNTGNGVIRLGGGNWGTLSNTDKYSVILTSAGNANSAGAQPGRSLMYACGTNMPSDSGSAACGVSYTDAVANNWILKDSSGNEIHYKGTSAVLTDIGNPAYQQKFIADIDADLRTHPGVDGLWIDDVTGSLFNSTPISTTYPSNASYRAAMLSFMNAVGPALRAKGWYVSVNASILDGAIESVTGPAWDGSQYIWWVNQIAPDIDGVTMEHWQQNWTSGDPVRTSGSTGSQAWDGWQRLVSAVQGLGKQFYPIGWGALSDVTKSSYLKGSFLLDWNGGQSAFIYSDNYSGSGDPWNPAWTADIGQPSAAKFQVGVGWRRNYTGGTVVVNPSPSSAQTFSLGATYLTPSGTSTSSVTLSPATAMILRSTSPPPTTTSTTTPTTSTTTTATSTTTPSTSTTTTTTTPSTSTTTATTTTTATSTTTSTTTPTTTTTPVAAPPPPSNTKPPAITGPDLVAKTIKSSQGSWNGATSFAYLWSRCDATGHNCAAITGANASTYLIGSADDGRTLVVTVIATCPGGSAFATSQPTAVIKSTGK